VNTKQRHARLERRRQHSTRELRTPRRSWHRTDPPRLGAELKVKQQAISFLKAGMITRAEDAAQQLGLSDAQWEAIKTYALHDKLPAPVSPPTEAEWAELVAAAKRRKRGIRRFAEAARFVNNGGPDRERTSWERS
jgi:hypothetical protein